MKPFEKRLCEEYEQLTDRLVKLGEFIKSAGFQNLSDDDQADVEALWIPKHRRSIHRLQELSMYVSGVLGSTGVDMIQVSDEDMKYKKGFHDMSFKNLGKK